LSDKLASLSLPLAEGRPSSPGAAHWSRKTYSLETNDLQIERVALEFGDDRARLIVRDERGEHPMQIGYATWLTGTTDVRGQGDEPVAACGAWTADDTFEVRICYFESEFCPILRLRYTSGDFHLAVEPNVSWGPTTVTTIAGQVADVAAS
jgi:hypothetical protein